MIIPSIDLMGGKAVQLRQGREKVLEREDVFELAERFSRVGELAVIDLDAALCQGENRALLKALCQRFPCRVGGGIRTIEEGRALLKAGARRIIVGTAAAPDFLEAFKPEHILVAVDERGGEIVDRGWTRGTGERVVERVKALEKLCSGFLYTVVDKEGMLQGTALDRIKAVRDATTKTVTAAGGISTAAEVRALADMGCEAQLGMAIYTGVLEPEQLFVDLVDFEKGGGLCATVVEDEQGRILMVAHSTKESLTLALREAAGIYYSRSRKEIWRKGETSGHRQTLVRARFDCDRDALRFTVRQKGGACHTGAQSCFGPLDIRLADLEAVLKDRLENPRDSYGSRLMANERMIRRKLHEETWEVGDAQTRDETMHEAADLLFFATALLVRRGLSWADVMHVLRGREK